MKKSLLVFSAILISLSLTAFGYINWEHTSANTVQTVDSTNQSDTDLLYEIDSRFIATITKKKLDNATSVIDIFPSKATQFITSYQDVKVSVLYNDVEFGVSEVGINEVLNPAQIKLLKSAKVSTNIQVSAHCKRRTDTGELTYYHLVYYMTITPEKEAEYVNGHNTLINYLKENSKEETALIKKEKLKPGRVRFTVTKEGTVSNVQLSSTSGYDVVDKTLIDLIQNTSGKWNAATNSQNEKINQELVLFFGMKGC